MERVKVSVLFGSQTGTAQDIGERLGRQAKYYRFRSRVMPMDDYPIGELVEENVVLFVCSTTGQGEEPDNMKKFWRFLLRKHLPNDCLANLKCGVLGLGDSSYTKFNFAAKKLSKRLQQLGASEIIGLGLADDQHDLGADGVAQDWIRSLWNQLFQMYPREDGVVIDGLIPVEEPKYEIDFLTDCLQEKDDVSEVEGDYSSARPYKGTVLGNVRVTTENHFQDVRLIKIDISSSNMSYEPGDVAVVQPSNLQENIDDFFDIFHLDPESFLSIQQTNPDIPLPTIRVGDFLLKNWVKCYFDIQGVPRRYFFELLKHFGNSELENEKLEEFLSTEGQRDLYNYCHSAHRNCLEVLRDFPNAAEAFSRKYIFDLFPSIKPRCFSIASEDPNVIELLVAVVNYKTRLAKPRLGLCSNWIAHLQAGDTVPISVRRGTFKFVNHPAIPIIMIGPGTGCAPFRGFLLRRVKLNLGNNYLFYGCRNEEGDFFFKDEWSKMQQQGLLHLFTAFSRDQERKIYVQHVMLEKKKLLWELINDRKAYVYLAGSAKDMPQEVTKALLSIFQSEGGLTEDEASAFFKKLEVERRFQTETWS